ncbi:hypothetical protein HAX54_021476 [Datura stramonium]|uniref:Uncharacterized protein n=1 Tax=Datura stramonium TaxID=4076 RepID=A0ABS8USS9_DATST|nr:hypothetical protein [Datura stramonium]
MGSIGSRSNKAHFSREARIWLKTVCAWETYDSYYWGKSCLVYVLMNRVPVNVGVIIKNVLRRARIEEEEADYRPIYDPRGIAVTKTKEPKAKNEWSNRGAITTTQHRLFFERALENPWPRFEEALDDHVDI